MSLFIRPPYINCPKCNEEKFGINGIFDEHYSRRCDNCGYPRPNEKFYKVQLPNIKKKIIYLDQFAISNMMKSLHPKFKKLLKPEDLKFWRKLFGKLDSLSQLQLIICPSSSTHIDESLISKYYEPLKKIYELLGWGIKFKQNNYIALTQICEFARKWVKDESNINIDIDANLVTNGRLHRWQDRFFISLPSTYLYDTIDDTKKIRNNSYERLKKIFKRWQKEQNKTFEYWYDQESRAFGEVYLGIFAAYKLNLLSKYSNNEGFSLDDIMPPPAALACTSVLDIFERNGIEKEKTMIKLNEFFLSSELRNIPYIKIHSMLYAAIARKAASGQKKPPSPGMANDIRTIAALFPYCDAIFIDKECHALLTEKPLSKELDFGTYLFSLNNKNELFSYLEKIKNDAPSKHLIKVKEIYGDKWGQPYFDIFKDASD